MRQDYKKALFAVLVLMTALFAYAGGGRVQAAVPAGGSIAIEASNFSFSPKEVRVEKPGPLTIQIKNVSGSGHNFTLSDPSGRTLKSVDLKPGQTVNADVQLSAPGVYKFHCDKAFHSSFGMTGQIIVGR